MTWQRSASLAVILIAFHPPLLRGLGNISIWGREA